MIRSLVASGRSSYTCLCVTRQPLVNPTNHLKQGQRCFQMTPSASVLQKDLKGKKGLIKMSQEAKLDVLSLEGKEDVTSGEGSTPLGSDQKIALIPDLTTNGMVVNGIRFDELPILHMKCSPNNTIAQLTDHTGLQRYGRSSCGMEGFRNSKKSSTVAAQAVGMSIGYTAMKKGVEHVRVAIKGIGSGRLPALKGVEMAGVKIISITDRTPIFVNGSRPRKARRL